MWAWRARKTPRLRELGHDVNALKPPDPTVPPVAPLERHGRLADNRDRGIRPSSSGVDRGDIKATSTPQTEDVAVKRPWPSVSRASRTLNSTMRLRNIVDRGHRGPWMRSGIRGDHCGGRGRGGWLPGGYGSPRRSARRGPRGRSWPGPHRAARPTAPRGMPACGGRAVCSPADDRSTRGGRRGRHAVARLGRDDPQPRRTAAAVQQMRPAKIKRLDTGSRRSPPPSWAANADRALGGGQPSAQLAEEVEEVLIPMIKRQDQPHLHRQA